MRPDVEWLESRAEVIGMAKVLSVIIVLLGVIAAFLNRY